MKIEENLIIKDLRNFIMPRTPEIRGKEKLEKILKWNRVGFILFLVPYCIPFHIYLYNPNKGIFIPSTSYSFIRRSYDTDPNIVYDHFDPNSRFHYKTHTFTKMFWSVLRLLDTSSQLVSYTYCITKEREFLGKTNAWERTTIL